jgi:hypothetical protein
MISCDDSRRRFDRKEICAFQHLRLGDPSDLSGKALDVVLLLLQVLGGHKHGEVGVLHSEFLDLEVEPH